MTTPTTPWSAVQIYAGLPRCPRCGAWLELHDRDDHSDFWFCLPPKGKDCGLFLLPRSHWAVPKTVQNGRLAEETSEGNHVNDNSATVIPYAHEDGAAVYAPDPDDATGLRYGYIVSRFTTRGGCLNLADHPTPPAPLDCEPCSRPWYTVQLLDDNGSPMRPTVFHEDDLRSA